MFDNQSCLLVPGRAILAGLSYLGIVDLEVGLGEPE